MEFIERFLVFTAQAPLNFTDGMFWVFFTLLMAGFCLVYQDTKKRNLFLMLASLFFYYKSSGIYVLVLLFSICVDFYLGGLIYKATTQQRKKWLIAACVLVNLNLLGFFKYANFATEIINQIFHTNFIAINYLAGFWNTVSGDKLDIYSIFLPVGISFYTFQSLSYAIDIYRGEIKPVTKLLDYAFFVSFFPQLVAGPIVRASEFLPQIHKPYHLTNSQFSGAIYLIIAGLVKKMVISDYLSVNLVDRIFSAPNAYTGFENLMAIYAYSIQIYCDFSGYTDIAIGIAQLLGFQLTLNFLRPYQSENITEFWRRWHISLSRWLKDYLYISLGGNRKGKVRTNINLFLTMLIGGLWHGAHLRYILWGALHGLALIIHKYWAKHVPITNSKVYRVISILITFHFVAFCWIFFRAEKMDIAMKVILQIKDNFAWSLIPDILMAYQATFNMLAIGILLHFMPQSFTIKAKEFFANADIYRQIAIITLAVFFIYQFKTASLQPFIYFQF